VRSSTAETGRLKQASMARLWEVAAAVVVYVAVFTIQRLLRVVKSRALGRGRRKCDQFWYVFSSMAVHWDPRLTRFKDVAAMSSFLCPLLPDTFMARVRCGEYFFGILVFSFFVCRFCKENINALYHKSSLGRINYMYCGLRTGSRSSSQTQRQYPESRFPRSICVISYDRPVDVFANALACCII
jgi:hypothetical protein